MLLSGGIDSSALTALAAEESAEPVRTFSIGFEERSFDELSDARLVAERYGTQHRELVLSPDAALLLPALADAFDEPFADSSALPTYLVSQLAASDVKVALSGEGGDELFGGYYTYVADLLAQRTAGLARVARPLVERLPTSTARASFDYKAKRFVRAAHLPPLERHHGWKEIFSPDLRARLTGRRSEFDPVDLLRARFAETEGAELLARLQDVDFGVYLVDDLLVKTDRASMAHSLEARVPFLDPVVTNFAFTLPASQRVRGLAQEGASAEGGRAARAGADHPRQEARLLDPGRGVASRRARAVRERHALRGDAPPAGLLPAGGREVADRPPRGRRGGPVAAALGAARVHALARAPRRARARGVAERAAGGARPLSDLPTLKLELGWPRTELRRRLVDAVLRGEKTATAGLAELEEERWSAGDRLTVLGYDDEPVAIAEVVEERVIPAGEIDVQFARDEGEGFESVEDWREAHERFFERALPDDTLIVATRFRLVERL